MIEYPWYEVVDNNTSLSQGDFFTSCPIVVPTTKPEDGKMSANIVEYDVVVMSQACDLEHRKVDLVLVCPVSPLTEYENLEPLRGAKGKEKLRQGYFPGYHLLNECKIEGFEGNFLVVDFRNVYGVPFDNLEKMVKEREKRLRLLPPYREHLSQAFARFFMRVGLPVDIPAFK